MEALKNLGVGISVILLLALIIRIIYYIVHLITPHATLALVVGIPSIYLTCLVGQFVREEILR